MTKKFEVIIGENIYFIEANETIPGKDGALNDISVQGPAVAMVERFDPPLENLVKVQAYKIPIGFPTTFEGLSQEPQTIMAIRLGYPTVLQEVDAKYFPAK